MLALLVTLLVAAVIGYLVKLIVGLIAPQFADIAGVIAFLLVLLSRIGGINGL